MEGKIIEDLRIHVGGYDQVGDRSLASISALRKSAWEHRYPHYAQQVSRWDDQFDSRAILLTASIGEKLAGTARLNVCTFEMAFGQFGHVPNFAKFIRQFSPPIATMTRLAIYPEFMGRGIANALDLARIEIAKAQNCSILIVEINNTTRRMRAISDMGFQAIQGAENYPASPYVSSAVEGKPFEYKRGTAFYAELHSATCFKPLTGNG